MPSSPLDVRREQEGQSSSTPHYQPPAQNAPAPIEADDIRQRVTKPLPPTRHLSLEPAAVNRPREVSSPFPKGSVPYSTLGEAHHDDEPNFLVRASEEVLKVHPALDRGYLLDIMEEHFPKCTKEHIVQCTVQHFSTRTDYPRAQQGASKRKFSEGLVDDGQEGPAAAKRKYGTTPSLASSSDDGDSLKCELCKGVFHAKATSSCPAGHLFCHLCIYKAVSAELNATEPLVVCLDRACTHPFTRATLLDILPHEPLGLYDSLIANHTLKQNQRVDSCPQCAWTPKIKIPVSLEKTKRFSCEACGLHSCRVCKQTEHGLLNCKDVESTRTSQEADSDSDASHDSCNATPDVQETSLPPISPLVDAFPSAGEGSLLPSLRSTLGSSLGKQLSQPSSPSFSFRLNLPPLNASGLTAPSKNSPVTSDSTFRALTDPWLYSLSGDGAPSTTRMNPLTWTADPGRLFRPLHQPSDSGRNAIIHRAVERLQGRSGRAHSRPPTPMRRATFTGGSLTAPSSPLPTFEPLRLSLPFAPGLSLPISQPSSMLLAPKLSPISPSLPPLADIKPNFH